MNTIGGGGQHPLRSNIGHSTEDDSHLPSALPVPPIKIIPATPNTASSESRRESGSLFGNHKSHNNNHNHGQNGNSSGNNGRISKISKINILPSSGGKEKKLERIEEKFALAAAPAQGSMSDPESKEKDTSTSRKVQQMLKNRVHKGHVTISTISKKFGHGVVRTKSGNLRRSNSAPGSSAEPLNP
jgi:hypothetical protein